MSFLDQLIIQIGEVDFSVAW